MRLASPRLRGGRGSPPLARAPTVLPWRLTSCGWSAVARGPDARPWSLRLGRRWLSCRSLGTSPRRSVSCPRCGTGWLPCASARLRFILARLALGSAQYPRRLGSCALWLGSGSPGTPFLATRLSSRASAAARRLGSAQALLARLSAWRGLRVDSALAECGAACVLASLSPHAAPLACRLDSFFGAAQRTRWLGSLSAAQSVCWLRSLPARLSSCVLARRLLSTVQPVAWSALLQLGSAPKLARLPAASALLGNSAWLGSRRGAARGSAPLQGSRLLRWASGVGPSPARLLVGEGRPLIQMPDPRRAAPPAAAPATLGGASRAARCWPGRGPASLHLLPQRSA